jgi:hypothetical protein
VSALTLLAMVGLSCGEPRWRVCATGEGSAILACGRGVGPQCAKQKLSSTSSVLATPTPLGADSVVEGIVKVIGVS